MQLMEVHCFRTHTCLSKKSLYFRWAADQVLGEPNVYPTHGDIEGAWAHRFKTSCSNEHIEV